VSAGLYARAVAGALPLARPRELPATRLAETAEIDPGHLSRYSEVCGFEAGVPVTYPHVLAFPLALRIMTSRRFPFAVLGLVHIGNEITQHRPLRADEPLALEVWAEDLKPHARGTQVTLTAAVSVEGRLVWEERSVYLHRSGGGSSSGPRGEPSPPPPAREHFRVPADIGRRYGAVSGDRNPIHLHPLSAKLFGMPRPIAHGMWLQARCLAALALPDAFTTSARFRLPVQLPATVALGTREGGEFELTDASSGRPHVAGWVR
jgi:acyl dehydratase